MELRKMTNTYWHRQQPARVKLDRDEERKLFDQGYMIRESFSNSGLTYYGFDVVERDSGDYNVVADIRSMDDFIRFVKANGITGFCDTPDWEIELF